MILSFIVLDKNTAFIRFFWYTNEKVLCGSPHIDDLGGIPMAENKQYVTQIQDNGTIMISEEVIATIVSQAIAEVEGTVSLNTKPGAEIVDMIGKKNWGKGMKIVIGEDEEVTVDCDVLVGYNQNVVAVAQAVQNAVAAALESATGVKVAAINVNVRGIIRQ